MFFSGREVVFDGLPSEPGTELNKHVVVSFVADLVKGMPNLASSVVMCLAFANSIREFLFTGVATKFISKVPSNVFAGVVRSSRAFAAPFPINHLDGGQGLTVEVVAGGGVDVIAVNTGRLNRAAACRIAEVLLLTAATGRVHDSGIGP